MQTYTFQSLCTPFSVICLVISFLGSAIAQDNSGKQTIEPVFRVPKIGKQRFVPPNEAAAPKQIAPVINPAILQRNEPTPITPIVPVRRNPVVNPAAEVVKQQPAAPVRVADARIAPDKRATNIVPNKIAPSAATAHPLDRAIEDAKNGLAGMQKNVVDYTAVLVRRERVDNRLSEPNYIKVKIRNPRVVNGRKVPFSIYMKFIRPKGAAGREVIWVDGRNNNNLIAHETSPLLRFKNFNLDPTGFLAMKGNKYPIYDAGLENLTLKLIEKAERDRLAGHCEVRYTEDATVHKRPCSLIEVKHDDRRHPYEFHLAKVYIDKELQMPVRFESFDWPVGGAKPKVLEQYTYVNIQTNVGLTDQDFSISNPAYNFAR